MTNRHVVIFTIGPVQSFIASARRTEDLWSGSYILSYLAREAMKALYQIDEKIEIVFPKVSKEELNNPNVKNFHIASIPNRFTAIVQESPEQVYVRLTEVEQSVRNIFTDFCFQAVEEVFPSLSDEEKEKLRQLTEQQIRSFLEIYWVIEPYVNESFKEARERAEKRLGALKNEKTFEYISQTSFVCTVCKEREALCLDDVHPNDRYSTIKQKLVKTWSRRSYEYKQNEEKQVGKIKDSEFLCGICLAKRAARPYFEETFKQAGAKFRPFPSVVDIGHGNYYAIIMMDGDNMGKLFSGDKEYAYSEVSEKLARFAQQHVPHIVEKHDGKLVYAGGDDVLAFAPVDKALMIAEELRFAFSDQEKGLGDGATASFGVIIGHKKAPLHMLLDGVRKLEKKAKSYRKEKDALALSIYMGAGEILETVLPWKIEHGRTTQLLLKFVDLLHTTLSSTFIYRFLEAFSPLLEQEGKWEQRDMLRLELYRLLHRSKREGAKHVDVHPYVEHLMKLHDVAKTGYDFLYLLKMLTFFRRKEGAKK
ncbi:MAG: type III-B CRISPR-associated protein Cas10/Cmr2 [Anoxybacillus sp.]|nr:MAG: type III-B CRISPR-associated protein Cas10/Cmr2 [Anoxybacillus sp.]